MLADASYAVDKMNEDVQDSNNELALPQDERRKQIRVTYAYLLVALGYCVSFWPLYTFVFHQEWMAWVNVAFAAACIVLLFVFRRTHNTLLASLGVGVLAATVVTLMSLFRSPPEGATYGVFGGSVFLFFALPRKYYITLVGAIVLVLVLAVGLSVAGYVLLPYTRTEYGILIASLLFDNALLVLYGREKAKVDRKLNTSLKEIRKLAHELATENERVEAEVKVRTDEYKREHAKLETSIESLRIGFILLDQDANILSINNTAVRILYSQTEPKPHKLPDHMTMDEVSGLFAGSFQFRERVGTSIKERHPFNVHDLRFGDRFLAIGVMPVVEDDKTVGAVVLLEDTTDTKALERSREEFFSIASHELRTPLTSIVGNATMAQQYYKQLDEKQTKEMLQDISSAGKRLITIVNDFLDLSRLEQGGVAIQLEATNLNTMVHDVLHDFKDLADEKNLRLNFVDAPKPAVHVMADPGRLKQILVNVVGNGIKYTDQGEVVVNVVAHKTSTDIVVRDTGKGIAPESQYLLFRKFQQASDNILTRDNSQSTGLGLYISKMIAKVMKGDVRLERSVLGEGSTFVVTIPTAHKS